MSGLRVGPIGEVTFTPAGTGAVSQFVQNKLREHHSLMDSGALGDGSTDDAADVQTAADNALSVEATDGTYQLGSGVTLSAPKKFEGAGTKTVLRTTVGFAATPILTISPTVGSDPKNWEIGNFTLTNQGSATVGIKLDLTAGKYLSKFTLRNVVSTATVSTGRFVELNNVNIDGLFTSLICDNWSYGGYYLDNVGDSVMLERNTTTGAGVGYYVNQLGTAANLTIRDGNCTCTGGALYAIKCSNLLFENMQVECPSAFTGSDNAAISLHRDATGLIFNSKILYNNINTQGNPKYCIYLQFTDLTLIEGNQLYCDPATGAHIYIDAGARNTLIGLNKYFRTDTGAEIDPIITDNGIGTMGIWKDATITLAGWAGANLANEHAPGFFKDRDGNVILRGRATGGALAGGETLFTLPVGFRPKTKAYLFGQYGAGGTTSCVVQIISTGAVQLLTAGATGVYLNGIKFSTK